MAKIQTKFICTECGAQHPRWMGKCVECGSWNTLVEEIIEPSGSQKKSSAKAVAVTDISAVKNYTNERIKIGITEFDQVLGGGIVPGSLILLGGDPGIGKSTLIIQAVSKSQNTLYVSGEESERQIKLRAERLGIKDGLLLVSETNIDTVIATILEQKPTLAVIDSIQTMYSPDIPGTPGSVSQLSLCSSKLMNIAKENHIAIILIGHVTKDGNIAGPKVLEHLVDVVLYLEGERFGSFRILRGIKNRFGSTNETGIFEMSEKGMFGVKNPSELMISERAQNSSGSVIYPAMEGTRPLLVEVQALCATTNFGYPKRTASGFDLNRLNLLSAVLTKKGGFNLTAQDIYLNVAGGIYIREPAADLAVCLSVSSAFKNKNIKEDMVIFGEVGLAGEVRSVNNIDKRLAEASKLGFGYAVIPKSRFSVPNIKGLNIIPVANIREAIEKVL